MTRSTPQVRLDTLLYQQNGRSHTMQVDTPEWYAWLNDSSTFAFQSEFGSFTARKELAGNRRGGEYWKAYRTRNGKLHRKYLGKSDALTIERLHEVALVLSSDVENVSSIHPSKHALDDEGANDRPSNLPAHLPRLIGREKVITTLSHLLQQIDKQFVTLAGMGGVGKTSLALHVADGLRHEFAQGVFLVSLAHVNDPPLVFSTIAQTFDLRASGDRTFQDVLVEFLHSKQLLLVLDNFEQVLPAASLLGVLLENCPALKILVTSREPLNLRQEHIYTVQPLDLPDTKQMWDITSLSRVAAISLFVQRTQAVKADFCLTEANAGTIAEICRRLDGLPLAIELAATRMRLLSPQQLLTRLDQRLQLLTGGARDLPARHQTLRSTIQWSYDLLNAGEQRLFRRLAIFVDGCSVEAIESVGERMNQSMGEEPVHVLDACISLLDKQLIQQRQQADGNARIYMLETIREFALECLHASGEANIAGDAHARYFLACVEKSAPPVFDAQEMEWFNALDLEQDNLRASLNWFIEKQDTEEALHLSANLVRYWAVRGHMYEARQWLEHALHMRTQASLPVVAHALSGLGWLSIEFGEYVRAVALCTESFTLNEQLGDFRGMALASHRLGGAYSRIDQAEALLALEKSVSLYRRVDDNGGLAYSLMSLGTLNLTRKEYALARMQLQEGLDRSRALGNKEATAWSLLMLALLLMIEHDLAKSMLLVEESLGLFREIRNKQGQARALLLMGELKSKRGTYVEARSLLEESLVLLREVGTRQFIAQALLKLAGIAAIQGNATDARIYYEECLNIVQEIKFETGLTVSLEEFRKQYLSQGHVAAGAPNTVINSAAAYPSGLTTREVEVLRLLAGGLTNAQIAEELVISTSTVNAHLRSIYNKLEVTSRTAAARFAYNHRLL